jgi:hypothetical protein
VCTVVHWFNRLRLDAFAKALSETNESEAPFQISDAAARLGGAGSSMLGR